MSMLQRRAIGGGKTQSRKAKNRDAQQAKASSTSTSRAGSIAGSRPGSAVPSRAGSEYGSVGGSRVNSGDEDSGDEGDPFSSITRRGHGDNEVFSGDDDMTIEDVLQERIEKMLDTKKKGVEAKEEDMHKYNQTLLAMDAREDIADQQGEIIEHLLKAIKGARTEKETLYALKGISLTTLTNPEGSNAYSAVKETLMKTIIDTPGYPTKATAITTLSLCAFFGGADVTSTTALITFLHTIVSTDGSSISAHDSPEVVISSLNSIAFLLTSLDSAADLTPTLMPPLIDQLDSSDPEVQIAAGEAIALLYEKSWIEVPNEWGDGMVKQLSYAVYDNTPQLLQKLKEISSGSRRYLNKRDKKTQHQSLVDVAHSVEHPGRGPRYSEAMDKNKNVYGSRMAVKVRGRTLVVSDWWCFVRLKFLKGVVGGGWDVFVEKSEAVMDCLVSE